MPSASGNYAVFARIKRHLQPIYIVVHNNVPLLFFLNSSAKHWPI